MKIAIWGLGVSGIGALKYLTLENQHEIFAINQGDKEGWCTEDILNCLPLSHCFDQKSAAELCDQLDLVILSPGIDPRIPELRPFLKVKKICDIEYVFQFITKPIIAVTGTNGKTSTVTMLGECLALSGANVFVGGNIGRSPFDSLQELDQFDYFVFELSSFQLELMDKFRPFISVILNITENHMERYDHFFEYVGAKFNIYRNQTKDDFIIYDETLNIEANKASSIAIEELKSFDFSKSKLIGTHTRKNLFVVAKALELLKVHDRNELMRKFINCFSGVKYRLEFKRKINHCSFYNDAKSTNTAATITALSAFSHQKIILILGGKLRGSNQDFIGPLLNIIHKNNIQLQIYLFGESQNYLDLQLRGKLEIFKYLDLNLVMNHLDLNNVESVLFSPGFPSFDQYKDYSARGEHFDQLVANLL